MRVADSVLVLVDSAGGMEVGTETAMNYAAEVEPAHVHGH